MWIAIGNDFLNLNNVASVHFAPDDDGVLTATVETFAGNVKHYRGPEATVLHQTLDGLAAGPAK
jgi:hypothetical protein